MEPISPMAERVGGKRSSPSPHHQKPMAGAVRWTLGLAVVSGIALVIWVAGHRSWRQATMTGIHIMLVLWLLRMLETRNQETIALKQKLTELRSRLRQ